MPIIILTCEEDVTADLVVRKLGDKVIRLDPGDFPGRITLTATFQGGRYSGSIETDTRRIRLRDIESVWVRRPGKPGPLSGPQQGWAGHESTHAFMGALRALPGVRWMNHPDAQEAARYKLGQLAIAHRVGFSTPSTLVTTDSGDATAYLSGMADIVCKSVSGRQPDAPPMTLPTTRVPPGTDLSQVDGFPTCFQRTVPKVADLRITVVGREAFCARTVTQDLDWRYAERVTWSGIEAPKRTVTKILNVMDALGLNYGAFDFVEDADGRWWFLEVNPAGQFAFIEKDTGLPISQAIADWLLGL